MNCADALFSLYSAVGTRFVHSVLRVLSLRCGDKTAARAVLRGELLEFFVAVVCVFNGECRKLQSKIARSSVLVVDGAQVQGREDGAHVLSKPVGGFRGDLREEISRQLVFEHAGCCLLE